MFKFGIIGTIIAAICCFTPILVWVFTALGAAGLIAYLDFALLPALGIFIVIAAIGFTKKYRSKQNT